MAIIASDSGGGRDFEPVSVGAHAAICDMMVDLGMQDGGNFGPKRKAYFRFQIPGERIEYEKGGEKFEMPAVIGVTYTVSLSEKSNLRPFLEAWRGKAFKPEELREFDITAVLGAPALLNVIHEPGKRDATKTYARIASIMPMPKGMGKPVLEGEAVLYDDDNQDSYDTLPQWLREKIDSQLNDDPPVEQSSRHQPAAFDADLDDDIPF